MSKAKENFDSVAMARAFHDLTERMLLSSEELDNFREEGYCLQDADFLERLLENFFETLDPNEISDAITLYATNLVYIYDFKSSYDSNKLNYIIDNLQKTTNDPDLQLPIKELKGTAKIKEKLDKESLKLLDGKICEAKEIKKWDLIKCHHLSDFCCL